MGSRQVIAGICFILIFNLFLYWLFSTGRINVLGIIVLVLGSIFFIGTSHFLYKKLWSDDEE